MFPIIKKGKKEVPKEITRTVMVCPYCGGIGTIKHNEEVDPGYNTEECTKCGHVEFGQFGVMKEIKEDD